jgi:hypothetical protein
MTGLGNPRELGLNIPDLRHRAECGSAVAQTILGTCYLEGVEVGVDHKEALEAASDNELIIGCAARSVLRTPRSTALCKILQISIFSSKLENFRFEKAVVAFF